MASEEEELMRLRVDLGDVLNKESELRAKEKKLRSSIKKLQRKISILQNEIPYGKLLI